MKLNALFSVADLLVTALGVPVPPEILKAAETLATALSESGDPVAAIKATALSEGIRLYENKVFADLEKIAKGD